MKNRTLYILLAGGLMISILGCENIETNTEITDQLVLNAYLYENEPVTDIRISKSLPFTSGDTIFPMVSDAVVNIQWRDTLYPLVPSGEEGFYHCTDSTLQIIATENYSIEAIHQNRIVTAETRVPVKPDSMRLSASHIEIDPDMTPREIRESGLTDIEVTWANPEGDYFYVLVENLEENPEDIEFGFGGMGGRRPNFRLLTQPFITDTYIIRIFLSFQQYGTHRVKLYRVNQEYADLYEYREQDSRNLTEPLTNVNNGLGIFTAFSYDEAFFEVVKK